MRRAFTLQMHDRPTEPTQAEIAAMKKALAEGQHIYDSSQVSMSVGGVVIPVSELRFKYVKP